METRHLYGPNVEADDVASGVDPINLTFSAVTTPATVGEVEFVQETATVESYLAAGTFLNEFYFARKPTPTLTGNAIADAFLSTGTAGPLYNNITKASVKILPSTKYASDKTTPNSSGTFIAKQGSEYDVDDVLTVNAY